MRLLAILTAAFFFSLAVGQAPAENYGGVSPQYRAKMIRLIHKWFDSQGVGDTMTCIAERESGFNPKAYNDDWAPYRSVAGLFQIEWRYHATPWERNSGYGTGWWHFYKRMSDPVQNVKLAFRLYKTGGLSPWGGGC